MLFAMEIDPEQSKAEFAAFASRDQGKGVKDFMGSMGLGGFVEQLEDLKLGELLETPPPGLDEAIAITKVVQFIKGDEYAKFTRIIFDTAPTGHTLRLLSLPDFLDAISAKWFACARSWPEPRTPSRRCSAKAMPVRTPARARGPLAPQRADSAALPRLRVASWRQAKTRLLRSWRRSRRGCRR
jgi:anion-transporting  ArsA/GET3 family ATPase